MESTDYRWQAGICAALSAIIGLALLALRVETPALVAWSMAITYGSVLLWRRHR